MSAIDLDDRQPWPFPGRRASGGTSIAGELVADDTMTVDEIEAAARQLVANATAAGLVLTIDQEPLQPLAMGHYRTVVSVRKARGCA